MANFTMEVIKIENKAPMIVHCRCISHNLIYIYAKMIIKFSAGVGRTGTFILVHSCMKTAKIEGALNPLAVMARMRSMRPNMVDNEVH